MCAILFFFGRNNHDFVFKRWDSSQKKSNHDSMIMFLKPRHVCCLDASTVELLGRNLLRVIHQQLHPPNVMIGILQDDHVNTCVMCVKMIQ